MTDSLKHNVVFVFISNFVPSILTYGFWLIASNLTNSSVVGIVGSISSLAMILVAVSSLDIPIGMKRFLGKTFSEKNNSEFGFFSFSSLLIVLISSIIVLTIALNPWIGILDSIGIEAKFVFVIVIIVISNNLQNVFRGILTSSFKSKSLLIPSVVSSVIRLLSLVLVFFIFGLSEIEIAWTYSIFYIGLAVGLFIVSKNKILKPNFEQFKLHTKLVVKASIPRWIPVIISIVGTHLSILVIFSTKGASESGQFFIPYAVFGIIIMISGSINQISHPVWSGMKNAQEQIKLLEKNLRFTFLATIPLAVAIILLNTEIVTLFGNDFSDSGPILTILMLSYPLLIIETSIFFLLHARGHYREVLYIGLAANIPRIILYFVLIPDLGNIGAAYAMVIGTVVQLPVTIIIAQKLQIRIPYRNYVIITIIGYGIGFIMYLLELQIIGVMIMFIGTYTIFIKLKILDKETINEFCVLCFSKEKGDIVSSKIVKGLQKLKLL